MLQALFCPKKYSVSYDYFRNFCGMVKFPELRISWKKDLLDFFKRL